MTTKGPVVQKYHLGVYERGPYPWKGMRVGHYFTVRGKNQGKAIIVAVKKNRRDRRFYFRVEDDDFDGFRIMRVR